VDSSFDEVVASYHRARETGQLFDTFYRLFLGKSPEIPGMFAGTDFPHQKLMLRQSIVEMLVFAQSGEGRTEIERLGKRHRELHVTPHQYDLWLEALCEALAKHDSKYSARLEVLWRDAMRKGIDVMSVDST
jgi:hemoglobin-like flavoprotein